jgi:signal transduction histidine kinase
LSQSLSKYVVSALALILVTLGVLCAAEAARWQTPFAGFLVYRSGAVTSLWRAEWPGQRAGLRVRDRVLAVDGQTVHGGRQVQAAMADAEAHGRGEVTVEVRSPGSAPARAVRLPLGRLGPYDLGATFFLPFSVGLVYLLLGSVIFFAAGAGQRNREALLATLLCFVAAAFYLTMFDAHSTYRWSRVWIAYPLLGPLSVHLFAVFPEVRPRWARRRVLLPLYALGAALVVWRELGIDDPRLSDLASATTAAMLSLEFAADLGLLAFTMRRGASGPVRNRAKSIFVGLALTCTTSVGWQFASLAARPMSADAVMVLSACFPALIAYALLKRNLFDLDAVLRAGLIYALATGFVLAVYFAMVAVAGELLSEWAGHSTATGLAVATTLVAAALFHPVRLRAQRLVDRLLFAGPARDDLLSLLRALTGVEGAAGLAEAALPLIRRLSHARGVLLYARAGRTGRLELIGKDGEAMESAPPALPLGGPLESALLLGPRPQAVRELPDDAAAESSPLRELGAELLAPLSARGRLVGLLVLTAPRRGVYGYPVLRALGDVTQQLALALENATLVAEGATRERLAALGQLAAVIVHEVKNPLGIIKVAAGTLRTRSHDEASATLAACVEDEVDRIDATVRRLLELAKPPGPASRRPCDVSQVVRQTLDRLGPELESAQIQVRAELPPGPPVPADAEDLRAAILNLLLNARQAMPSGGALSVRVRREERLIEIDVEDTGVGMDDATRRQLFRPFFTTRHGGTGLGLALVKRVVEDHQGAIRVESRLGRGSRFTVTLPVQA